MGFTCFMDFTKIKTIGHHWEVFVAEDLFDLLKLQVPTCFPGITG